MKSVAIRRFGCLFLLLAMPLASMAATLATPDQDRYAKQAVPPSGKALIYVYRLQDANPQTVPDIWLNTRKSGQLETQTYGMWAAGPGRLEIRAGQANAAPLTVNCEAGRIYFIQLSVNKEGNISLRQVSYGTGRSEMRQAQLVLDPAIAARAPAPPPAPKPAPAPATTAETTTKATAAAPATEQAEPQRDEPAIRESSGLTLILKAGSFQLANGTQNILSFDRNFSSSGLAYGVEGEWRTDTGFAFGLEIFGESEDYTTTGSASTGSMAVTNVFFNAKKYFRQGSIVQPFLGAGFGAASTTFTGSINGSAGGPALQAMAGVVFRWQKVGLYTEYKFVSAKAEDASGESVDLSGSGLYAGLSVYF